MMCDEASKLGLFWIRASAPGDAITWGCLFGLIWWYLGPMTLLPLLLTGVCDWSTDAASALLPSLFGHLIYGAVTAVVFFLFDRGYTRTLLLDHRTSSAPSSLTCSPHTHGACVLRNLCAIRESDFNESIGFLCEFEIALEITLVAR